MKIKRISQGLVIALPRDTANYGVVISSTRMKNSWFKTTILCYNGDIATCRLKLKEDREHLYFRDYHRYLEKDIISCVNKTLIYKV